MVFLACPGYGRSIGLTTFGQGWCHGKLTPCISGLHHLVTQQPLRKVDSPKLEYCGVCFKSKGGKPGVVRYQVREKRVARDSEKAHKVYSKCTPKLVTTTETGKLNRIQYVIKAQCEGTRRRLVFERMTTNLEKQLKMRGFNTDPLKWCVDWEQ